MRTPLVLLSTLILLTTLLLSGLVPNAWASEPASGLYEITVKIENPMLGLSRTQSSKECITQEQFADGPDAFLNQEQRESECSIDNYSMANGRIEMSMQCVIPGGGKASMTGTGTYNADGFTMTNKMQMEAAGMKMDMQTVAVGKRVGDC